MWPKLAKMLASGSGYYPRVATRTKPTGLSLIISIHDFFCGSSGIGTSDIGVSNIVSSVSHKLSDVDDGEAIGSTRVEKSSPCCSRVSVSCINTINEPTNDTGVHLS